ncbi:MAG: hypothetical protein QM627_11120 [Luteolibacter sp.]
MKRWLLWMLAGFAVLLTSCGEYETVERELGYRGKARMNPWLAAERFAEEYGYPVVSTLLWKEPSDEQATWLMPMMMLSNSTYVRKVEEWIQDGGHAILIADYAEPGNDWAGAGSLEVEVRSTLKGFFDHYGVKLETNERASASEILFEGTTYKVSADSRCRVSIDESSPGVFATRKIGQGRLTVVTDGRIFRSRWISEQDHAALLLALIESGEWEGAVGFLRGSELSLWELVSEYLWAVLIATGVLVLLWLWKSIPRFGPRIPGKPEEPQRGYDHHLEALGFYQWRTDKCSGLLAPLRAQIVERGQRFAAKTGRRDDDFFQVLADLAGISRERVQRALAEVSPVDAMILTRTTADLQRLLHLLNERNPL